MGRVILVVAAHADDEALGCGGTMLRHTAEGDEVHVVFMADGVGARGGELEGALAERQRAAEKALAILGARTTTYFGLPDNRMDSLPLIEAVQRLERVIAELEPEIVYTHHFGDLNVDHRVTHQAVMTACRHLPGSKVREILAFEVMSSTEWASPQLSPFLPNLFVDISEHLEGKVAALEAYALEMRPPPHSRSIEHLRHLAHHRGSCVGTIAAEAFMVIRALR